MPEVDALLMLFLDFKTLIVHLQFLISTPIYILDNDSLLNGFRLYPTDLLYGAKDHHERVVVVREIANASLYKVNFDYNSSEVLKKTESSSPCDQASTDGTWGMRSRV